MFYFKSHPCVIRKISTLSDKVFITFDDGPSADLTEKILDILHQEKAKASFFIIGDRALCHSEIVQRTLDEGHAIFSHSVDHDYKKYLQSGEQLQKWLQTSFLQLEKAFKLKSNIFRPPAGVLTPPLIKVATALNLRLVLWNHRFFDTQFVWTIKKANRSISKIGAGDIILLHDFQKPSHHDQFLITLRHFIREIHKKNFDCAVLQ